MITAYNRNLIKRHGPPVPSTGYFFLLMFSLSRFIEDGNTVSLPINIPLRLLNGEGKPIDKDWLQKVPYNDIMDLLHT